jgi:hypothetical protein
MRHDRDDLVAARHCGREVAVTEARDLNCAGRAPEQVACAEAIADRAGADADDVCRHLQERVEGDDLVHLAAADVHVIRERVREVRSDRADFAAEPTEVVQQTRAGRRKLGQQRR